MSALARSLLPYWLVGVGLLSLVAWRWNTVRPGELEERAPHLWNRLGRPRRFRSNLSVSWRLFKFYLIGSRSPYVPKDLRRDLLITNWRTIAQLTAIAAALLLSAIAYSTIPAVVI